MPSNLYNNAEGGTNGTTVLTSNSGGASGPAFDSVTAPPVDGVLAFDNTHAAHGTLAYKFQIGATSSQMFLQWLASFSATNLNYVKVGFNSYLTANPPASLYQLHIASAAAAQVCGIRINTSGQLIIVSQAGTTIGTMTSAIPLNAWFRVEADIALDALGTSVQVTVARFDNIDSGQASDQVTATGTTAVPFSRIRFGWGGTATTNNGPWWMDDLQVWVPSAANPAQAGQTWRRLFKHRQQLPAAPVVASGALTADVSATVTETDTVTAVVAEFGAVTATVTSGSTVTAVVGTVGSVTATVTCGSTVAAVAGTVGAVTATVTCGSTVTAVVGTVGAVAAPVTETDAVVAVVGVAAFATRAWPGRTWLRQFQHRQQIVPPASIIAGALTADVAATVIETDAVTGAVGAVGAVSATVTAGSTVTAVVGVVGAVSTTVTETDTVTGSVVSGLTGAVTVTVTSGSTVTAVVGKVGGVNVTITSGVTTAAVTALFGSVTSTVTAGSTFTAVTALFAAVTSTVTAGSTITGTVGGAIIPTPTPPERILVVAVEARTAAVPVEVRVDMVPVKPGTAIPGAETRTTVVPVEPRTDMPVIG